jgi:hypothetical protein
MTAIRRWQRPIGRLPDAVCLVGNTILPFFPDLERRTNVLRNLSADLPTIAMV